MTERTRRWTVLVLVAGALVGLLAVGALVAPLPDGAGAAARPTGSPTAPSGKRLVGRGDLVLAVPVGWPVLHHTCGDLPAGDRVVVSGDFVRDCGRSRVTTGVDVEVTVPANPRPVGGTLRRVGREQVRVVESPAPDGAAGVQITLAAVESDTVFVLTGPRADVETVAATLRPVPDGYAVVPDTSFGGGGGDTYGTYVEAVRARFEAAGFVADVRREDTDRLPGSGSADRQAGTVARIGTTVTLTFD